MYFRLIRVRDFAGTLYGGNPLPTHNEEAIRGRPLVSMVRQCWITIEWLTCKGPLGSLPCHTGQLCLYQLTQPLIRTRLYGSKASRNASPM